MQCQFIVVVVLCPWLWLCVYLHHSAFFGYTEGERERLAPSIDIRQLLSCSARTTTTSAHIVSAQQFTLAQSCFYVIIRVSWDVSELELLYSHV